MRLDNLIKLHTEKPKKRVGRGVGSGKGGHTTGRGTKGQKARVGYKIPLGFEGGQTPLYKRMPKIGRFNNRKYRKTIGVSISSLKSFNNGSTIVPNDLVEIGILKKLTKYTIVKVLGKGILTKKLNLKGFHYSESVRKEIEKAGGSVE